MNILKFFECSRARYSCLKRFSLYMDISVIKIETVDSKIHTIFLIFISITISMTVKPLQIKYILLLECSFPISFNYILDIKFFLIRRKKYFLFIFVCFRSKVGKNEKHPFRIHAVRVVTTNQNLNLQLHNSLS